MFCFSCGFHSSYRALFFTRQLLSLHAAFSAPSKGPPFCLSSKSTFSAIQENALKTLQSRLALLRHATSKISSIEELERVATLGFRGEALAAIASVAPLQLTSRPWQQPIANMIDGRSGLITPAAGPPGTVVDISDLFGATPARRKFLKGSSTEAAHCLDAWRRIALAHPQIQFNFEAWSDGIRRRQERWPADGALERALTCLGDEVRAAHRVVDRQLGADNGLCLRGVVGLPEASRPRADQQFLFVNGRCVRDRTLGFAVKQAYGESLHGDRQPAFILMLSLDPALVDVNVHPAKTEVRFRDPTALRSFVYHVVADALRDAIGPMSAHRLLANEPGHATPLNVSSGLGLARWGGESAPNWQNRPSPGALDAAWHATYAAASALAVDTEAMGLIHGRDRLCLVQIADEHDNVCCLRIARGQTSAPLLQQLFENPGIEKVFHFARFDVAALAEGLGIRVNPIFCTKVASRLGRTYAPRHGLKDVVNG
jgi:DNA mismatch repair protein MutL